MPRAASGARNGGRKSTPRCSARGSPGRSDISRSRAISSPPGRSSGARDLTRAKACLDEHCRFTDARFELDEQGVVKHFDAHGWAWHDNPFVGTPELNGLKILMMLMSNWDNKDVRDVARGSNTAIFECRTRQHELEARYLIIDWGAALGAWGNNVLQRGRWDPEAFAGQNAQFVTGVKDDVVQFGYQGQRTSDLTANITLEDVRWFVRHSRHLTDDHLRAALNASGANREEIDLFTAALRARLNRLSEVADSSVTRALRLRYACARQRRRALRRLRPLHQIVRHSRESRAALRNSRETAGRAWLWPPNWPISALLQLHQCLIGVDPEAAINRGDETERPVRLGGGTRERPQYGARIEVERVQLSGRQRRLLLNRLAADVEDGVLASGPRASRLDGPGNTAPAPPPRWTARSRDTDREFARASGRSSCRRPSAHPASVRSTRRRRRPGRTRSAARWRPSTGPRTSSGLPSLTSGRE